MSTLPKQRIVVGLSGGVDSAVSAALLKRQGHEVVGIFMKNWEDDDDAEYCASNVDFVDAAAVAEVIGIEIEHVNFAAEYKDHDPPTPSGLVLAKHRFSPEQAKLWQGMVQDMLKDGTVVRILARHLPAPAAPGAIYSGANGGH